MGDMDTSRQENIEYPEQASAVIDVTKAPYFADCSGQTDCTGVLIQAFDDVMQTVLDGFANTVAYLEANPNAEISAESKRPDRVIFPHDTPPSRILYFPNGTYLVSDTLCYSFENLKNSIGNELIRDARSTANVWFILMKCVVATRMQHTMMWHRVI